MRTRMRWDTREYQRMASVRYHEGKLRVQFEDGSCASMPGECVLPPAAKEPNWSAVSFDPFEIRVPTAGGEVEIPWCTIREQTDPAYAAHLAAAAETEALKIGARLRALRERGQWSGEEVAAQAGITHEALARIEAGVAGIPLASIMSIVDAMGYPLEELVDEGV